MSKAAAGRKAPTTDKPRRRTPSKRTPRQTTVGQEMIAGLKQLVDDLEAGKDITKIYTFHRIKLSVEIPEYKADDVKRVREQLHASQAVFAMFLGVDVGSVQSWEQGRREPSEMARRFLEEIEANPRHWAARFKAKLKSERV
jgi:putative transcriptional regulator